jgi:hypothetical protein
VQSKTDFTNRDGLFYDIRNFFVLGHLSYGSIMGNLVRDRAIFPGAPADVGVFVVPMVGQVSGFIF